MKNPNCIIPVMASLLICMGVSVANPVKTVAWNGHPGAASFTFDDAKSSQTTSTLPQLDSRGIKATFNVNKGGDFADYLSTWIQAAKNGHEITNHTTNHDYLTQLPDSAAVASEVATHATYLRSLDPSIEAVTLAYPFCQTNGFVDAGVNTQNFIARTCGGTTQFRWGIQPGNWMRMTSYIMQPTTADNALPQLDNAMNNNAWMVLLFHGVLDGSTDVYDITPAQQNAAFDRAIANKLWIDTYQRIGSYYRASFTMDTVTAQGTTTGWKMAWISPHAHMPKSVLLRVTLDRTTFGNSFTVLQNGKAIPEESDGTFIIEFMSLALEIQKGGSASTLKIVSNQVPMGNDRFYDLLGRERAEQRTRQSGLLIKEH